MLNKNLYKKILLSSVAAVSFSVASFSVYAAGQSPSSYIDDSAITTSVKAGFLKDKGVSAQDIHVETMKGTVHLTGVAHSQAERDRAEAITRKASGVVNVDNQIVVMDDDTISSQVKQILSNADSVNLNAVQVVTQDGKVHLSGVVNKESDKKRAELLAKRVQGVIDVENKIEVRF